MSLCGLFSRCGPTGYGVREGRADLPGELVCMIQSLRSQQADNQGVLRLHYQAKERPENQESERIKFHTASESQGRRAFQGLSWKISSEIVKKEGKSRSLLSSKRAQLRS